VSIGSNAERLITLTFLRETMTGPSVLVLLALAAMTMFSCVAALIKDGVYTIELLPNRYLTVTDGTIGLEPLRTPPFGQLW
jgi:hypothetical protein